METLILENFRCFHEEVEVPIKPLTILVGENSTGKTSFLAAYRIASTLSDRPQPDFNAPPFDLGAFDQIASFAKGRAGRAKSFRLGYSLSKPRREHDNGPGTRRSNGSCRVVATFRSLSGQPQLDELSVRRGVYGVVAFGEQKQKKLKLLFERGEDHLESELHLPGFRQGIPPLYMLLRFAVPIGRSSEKKQALANEVARQLWAFFDPHRWSEIPHGPHASAPVRAKPRRTYDPKADAPEPEGNHVPMLLARICADDPARWERLKAELENFGASSGLFKAVRIKRYGSRTSGPFQVLLTISGAERNILDVGYGVSQALPIVTEAMLAETGDTFLFQQPEVHLHPRAQAAMGSLFGYLVKEKKQQVLVETHSDYLVDRVCLDVRDKKIGLSPSDVVILYFQREGAWVRIYPIRLDEQGNLVDAPPEYRGFFMEEQARHFRA